MCDVCHNIAKIERHPADGMKTTLCLHRKGTAQSFPSINPHVPEVYRLVGQPVMVPGDMVRYSFLATGTGASMDGSLGSACHEVGDGPKAGGAPGGRSRAMIFSRSSGPGDNRSSPRRLELAGRGAPIAYMNVVEVVEMHHIAGLCRKVARMRPFGVIKG